MPYPLTIFGNPRPRHPSRSLGAAYRRGARVRSNPPRRVVAQQSERVYEVAYRHVEDGKDYKHKFASGVCMELLGDGSVRLYRMDGRPLFKNFPD